MALETPWILADVIEVEEFPHLAQMYKVMGVPKTIINDAVQFTGVVPEDTLMRKVLEAIGEVEPLKGVSQQTSSQSTPLG